MPATAAPVPGPRMPPPPRPVPPRRTALAAERVARAPRPPLQRPRECAISGVAAGLARHLGAPVGAVRALFVLLALLGGAGIALYLWCWAFTPWQPGDAAVSRRFPIAWLLVMASTFGLLAIYVAVISGTPVTFGQFAVTRTVMLWSVVAATVALAVAAGLWAGLIDRVDPERGPRHAAVVRMAAFAVLTVAFLLPIDDMRRGMRWSILVEITPLLGVGIILATPLAVKWRELSGERIKRIREEQRAAMAAHLHDSVLQTLALIQNRSVASSEVARLARAQERELRAWLYDGDQPADSDLPTDLRDFAAALELDYAVRIDVVSAGLSAERASGEVAAAAREAMLNAARHAGGDVSVYIEGNASGVDVYIRDRGAGFDVDAVPDDRLGVRQSIIGRMRRAGGSGAVRSESTGTEVHLHYGGSARATGMPTSLEGGSGRG